MRHCVQVVGLDQSGPVTGGSARVCAGFPCWEALYVALAAILAALLAAAALPVWADDEAIENQKRNLTEMEQRVSDLEQDLDTRRARRRELTEKLERHERDIADLARSGHQLVAMIGEQERVLEKLRSQLAAERKTLVRQRADLGDLMRSAYAMGPGDRIRMLLDQDNSNRLSRFMAYYGFLNRFQTKRIEAVAQRARQLDGVRQKAEREQARLVSLAQKQDDTRARLAVAQEERKALLTSLEQTIATRTERFEDARAQAREMRGLLEQLEQQARVLPEAGLRQEPLEQLRGRLAWPLEGAPLLSHYGSLKGDGSQRWDGVVLAAEEGSEVRAIHHGRVAYADWLRGFGLLLVIEHDDDYMTFYGHNQTLLKEPGEWVAAGETIALSGSSGGRLSPRLYFAIRHRGRPLNPEHWCRHTGGSGRKSSAISS
ncbi:MAG: peptidoglycan DD-metalloendopeptidase family protein, partial [Chromatiaceae bacterium]|nr:peptidoglycan DD-metalloendopeptidase family protein [Chromatiaceae bacterium]